jgi:hypothetical protein
VSNCHSGFGGVESRSRHPWYLKATVCSSLVSNSHSGFGVESRSRCPWYLKTGDCSSLVSNSHSGFDVESRSRCPWLMVPQVRPEGHQSKLRLQRRPKLTSAIAAGC